MIYINDYSGKVSIPFVFFIKNVILLAFGLGICRIFAPKAKIVKQTDHEYGHRFQINPNHR